MKALSDLTDTPCNYLIERAVAQGRIPIAYTCSMVPDALLSVPPFFPVKARAPGVEGTESADIYLSSVICSYTRSILEYVLDGRYDFCRGWIFTASCDHMRRCYDNLQYLRRPEFIHILDVPHKITDEGRRWLADEISILAEHLADQFNVDMSKAAIDSAIAERNEILAVLSSIGALRKREQPPISGVEFHSIVAAYRSTPSDLFLPILLELRESLNARPGVTPRARLMLVGGTIDDPSVIAAVESQGGLVVADRFCTGSIPGITPIPRCSDPFEGLADHVFATTLCPRMMEDFPRRISTILDAAREYRVDGIVIESIKFCDTWGIEAAACADAIRSHGIPVLRIEREYRPSGEAQVKTRVQAFIESMGR